jgi:hypothetical protein
VVNFSLEPDWLSAGIPENNIKNYFKVRARAARARGVCNFQKLKIFK